MSKTDFVTAYLTENRHLRLAENHHILVVEDNPLNQTVAKVMLEHLGQHVTIAENGQEALNLLEAGHSRFDLVLMDMQMPVLDGTKTTQRWRDYENNHHLLRLPIVAMTANVMTEHRERCISSGMDDMIHKPFTRDELSQVICRYLPNTGIADLIPAIANDLVTQRHSSFAEEGEATQMLDERICTELQNTFEPAALDRLLSTFITRLSERSARLNAHWQLEEREALCREAHSLKGAAASLGCIAIAGQASQLEQAAIEAPLSELAAYLQRLAALQTTTQQALQRANILSS